MARCHFIIAFLILSITRPLFGNAYNPYNNVNFDYATISAMTSSYGAEFSTELLYGEQAEYILGELNKTTPLTMAVMMSKYMYRNALTTIGILGRTESAYYKRLTYQTLRVIMKTISVTEMLIQYPDRAIYWGPYILQVCVETQNLCKIFETMVANCRVSFRDLPFIQLAEQVKQKFERLYKLVTEGPWDYIGNNMLTTLKYDRDQLIQEITSLIDLAGKATSEIGSSIGSTADDWSGVVGGNGSIISTIKNMTEGFKTGITSVGSLINAGSAVTNDIKNFIPKTAGDMFTSAAYDISDWTTGLRAGGFNTYYSQRWYIYWESEPVSETIFTFTPEQGEAAVTSKGYWTIFQKDNPPSPTTVLEKVMNVSGAQAALDAAKSEDPTAAYSVITNEITCDLSFAGVSNDDPYGIDGTYKGSMAMTYGITITKMKPGGRQEVYEEIFDSYDANEAIKNARQQAKLQYFQISEPEKTFKIGEGEKIYYEATSEARMKGASEADIYIECDSVFELLSGDVWWKCYEISKSLNEKAKNCAMRTEEWEEDEIDVSDLEKQIEDLKAEQEELQNEQIEKRTRRSEILVEIQGNPANKSELQKEYTELTDRLTAIENRMNVIFVDLQTANQAKEERLADASGEQTGRWYRMPQIMRDISTGFNIKWDNEGQWNGYTFERKGTMNGGSFEFQFMGELVLKKGAEYILGIQTHRAQLQINWGLWGRKHDRILIDIIELDPSADPAESARIVDKRVKELREDNPNCKVTYEIKREIPETTDTEDMIHLLNPDERIEIARAVNRRMMQIFTDLVILERFMRSRVTVDSWTRHFGVPIKSDLGRRYNIADSLQFNWKNRADSAWSDPGYVKRIMEKYEIDEE